MQRFKHIFIVLPVVFCLTSCTETPEVIIPDPPEVGAWVSNSPYKWSHDGEPYSSVYCKVFSDSASYQLKEKAGRFGDTKFLQVLEEFNFDKPEDFRFPPGHDMIEVYLNRNHEERIAAAFWGCIIITIDSENFDTSRLEYLFLHELTHAFEYLIEGTQELGTDVWFREGIAIYCGGGRNYIQDATGLDRWISQNADFVGQGNPIRIHAWEDYPEGSDIPGFYTVFDLLMKYILDSEGMGRSSQDVLNLFYDVRNGIEFHTAFLDNFGISVEDLEMECFDRLRTYLEQK